MMLCHFIIFYRITSLLKNLNYPSSKFYQIYAGFPLLINHLKSNLAAERRKEEIGEIACRSAGVGQLPIDDLHLHLAVVAGLEHQVVEVEVTVL